MTSRIASMRVSLLVACGILTLRLIHLQLLHGNDYLRLAEHNRLRLVPAPAPRGLIVDRQGRVLAANETVFRVAVVPQEVDDLRTVLARVSAVAKRPLDALQKEYGRQRSLAFVPATIVPRVPKDAAIRLEEERWRLPGLLIKAEPVRSYPLGSTAAHLLGYLSQPTADEAPLLKQYGVRPTELVGRKGIEQLLDHALRGRPGGLMVEVNHRAKQVRVLGKRSPEPGARVMLTIDAPLQSLIEQAFGGQAGAAVVLDPHTGAVLAMASVPAFPPQVFLAPDETVSRLLNNPDSPLMNRATVGAYQPGSIVKLVTAAAGLEYKVMTPTTGVVCSGAMTIGDRAFHCWNRDGHGPMILREALMQSCNVYFMHVGRKVGAQGLRDMFEQVGFSHRTGWPLEEQPGHTPQRRLSEGEVALLAIGQGELSITVLQAAVMAAVWANKGWVVQPWVVSMVGDRPATHPGRPRRLGWSADTFEAVRQGMKAVVADPFGTGHRAYTTKVSIAGKTGTAQTHVPGRTHGWFVGFCPVEQPRAAIAIVTEYGGSGGDLPAEIARTICEYIALPEAFDAPAEVASPLQPEHRP